jgi:hypothetical protein
VDGVERGARGELTGVGGGGGGEAMGCGFLGGF